MQHDLVTTSDALVDELVPLPPDAPDVCSLCRSGRTRPTQLCFSCARTSSQVAYPCELVIPISYYTTPSPLRERMHDFKQHDDPEIRAIESRNVASIAARYVSENHGALIEVFGEWDATVAVPSTLHDRTPALQQAIESNFPEAFATFERPLRRGPGEMGFNRASEDGFIADADLNGARYLVIDDTFTTGARTQSAHHALLAAGASVAATIIVTRKINPDPKYGSDLLWDRQSSIKYDFATPPWWVWGAG